MLNYFKKLNELKNELIKKDNIIKESEKANSRKIDELQYQFSKEKIKLMDDIEYLNNKIEKQKLKHNKEIEEILKEQKAIRENEITTLLLNHDKKLLDIKEQLTNEYNNKLQTLLDNNYKTLSDSLSKLHNEGNAQTNFIKDMAITLANNMTQKSVLKLENNSNEL
jgi:hypothetical protein